MWCMMKPKNSKSRTMIILFLFLSIINLPFCKADGYSADLEITVDNSGFVTIEGTTDHPDLLAENTEIYTSKQQSFWLLNITKNESFSDFVFTLTLPENSEINYVKSSGSILIGEELGNLVVKGLGENQSFSLIVQYKTQKILEQEEILGFDLITILLLIGMVILIILFFIVLLFVDRQKKLSSVQLKDDGKEIVLRGLNERQKKIVKLLVESNRALTQTEIQRELNIPKAAVSRNIRGLEIKGLVEKEQIGISNLIRLKKP